MMTEQQEALRLADALVKHLGGNTASQAAVELRRLHEVTESLWQVAHHRNDRITMLEAAMRQALEALNEVTGWQWAGPMRVMDEVEDAINALTAVLADHALDKKAENAREIGLDYEPEQQEPKQSEIFCGVDFADGMLSVSVLRRRADDVAELIHAEQIELNTHPARDPLTDEEIEQCMKQAYATVQGRNLEHAFARAIEAAHGITGEKK